MSRKNGRGKRPSERAYARLTRHERNEVARLLDRGWSARRIAAELGRAPSTVANEVAAHRYVTAPRGHAGEHAPGNDRLAEACPRLGLWPHCCNGCRRRGAYGCGRRPRVCYDARLAQAEADEALRESRRGIDMDPAEAEAVLAAIDDGVRRGLSPEQVVLANPGFPVSASTIYRWVGEGWCGVSNIELRRKVGYRPRRHAARALPTRHSARRSHDAFLALGEACGGTWEMDTVEGRRSDSACLLTLLHRPSRFQLVLPMPSKEAGQPERWLRLLAEIVRCDDGRGEGWAAADAPHDPLAGMRRAFPLVLTDNGAEFADEAAIAEAVGEREGETRPFYCDARRSDQKGACEKNHVELRKLLPKGEGGVSLEGVTRADCAVVMSQVNSVPRASLGGLSPVEALCSMLGLGADLLLEALGIESLGFDELLLSIAAVNRARAERGEAPLA